MKSKLLLGVVFVVMLTVLGVALLQRPASSATTTVPVTTTTSTSTTPGTPAATSYTMAQVATHNNASSCWAAINGNVYDLTNWINQHPGGPERILSICGTDGSAAFNAQHGGQRQPAQELQNFLLGPLAS
jgi:cytochrome b involved in lipid metabolism